MATKTDYSIALVHESLTIPGGAERVLLEFNRMFPQAPIYTPLYRPDTFAQFRDAKIITAWINRFAFIRNHHPIANPLLPYTFEQFNLAEYDIVLSSSTAAAKGVLTRPETIHICYCHAPMRWAWLPWLDPRASSSFIRRLSAHYLRLWDVASANRVDYWIANSQTTADRIKKFYRREAHIIYPPVDVDHITAGHESDDYYLVVGRLVEQKRVDIIIEAAKQTGKKLKIAGSGPMESALKAQAAGAATIEFLGFVSEAVKNELYARCRAFIFASEEDFGIVPIEAMAHGKPVICYGRGGASETVIDHETGIHFATQTAESLAQALAEFESLTFNPDRIATHAKQFSANRFRKQITDFLNHIASKQ